MKDNTMRKSDIHATGPPSIAFQRDSDFKLKEANYKVKEAYEKVKEAILAKNKVLSRIFIHFTNPSPGQGVVTTSLADCDLGPRFFNQALEALATCGYAGRTIERLLFVFPGEKEWTILPWGDHSTFNILVGRLELLYAQQEGAIDVKVSFELGEKGE